MNQGDQVEATVGIHKGQQGTLEQVKTTYYVRWPDGSRSGYTSAASLKPVTPRVPLRGACCHLWNSPDIHRELDLIHDAGANCVRFDVNWKQPDKHWRNGQAVYVADVMAYAAGLGLKVIASFLSSDAAPADDVTRKEYAAAAAKFCKTYAGQLAALEVWNEPNGEGNLTPAAYAALVKATFPAVKAVSQVPVIVGSLARADAAAISWLNQAINAGMPRADGVAAHPYSSKWPVSTVGTALDVSGLNWLHTTLGPSVPIYVTEFGCSTVSKTVDPQYSVTEGDQARLINVAWQDVDTLPFVKAATLYNCVENGGDTIWGRWGVVRRDWTLKPGYATFKAGITR